MKNVFVLFILTCYMLSSVSWSIGVHECASEKSYSLFGIQFNDKCECDHSDEEHTNCCKDNTYLFKAENQDKLFKKEASFKKLLIDFPASYCSNLFQFKTIFFNIEFVNCDLPTGHSPPLYILHRVFRI